jgi:hypothetical protein
MYRPQGLDGIHKKVDLAAALGEETLANHLILQLEAEVGQVGNADLRELVNLGRHVRVGAPLQVEHCRVRIQPALILLIL